MKTTLHRTLDNTAAAIGAVHHALAANGPTARNNSWPILLALTPPVLAAYALTEVGLWTLREIQRQLRIHEKRPASPSLRGTPTPTDLLDEWQADPRTMATRLRLGSRLSDLDPTLDRTVTRRKLPNGKTLIKSRAGGMKGWLSDRRIAIPYSTAMRYKKLAQRLRQILALDDRLPLEWLIDGLPENQTLPPDLAAPYTTARRRLAKILEKRTLASLTRYAEKELGIVRLVTVRKASPHPTQKHTKLGDSSDISIIPRRKHVSITPARIEGTRMAIQRILGAQHPSPETRHLRNRLRHWLAGLHKGHTP